MGEQVQRYQLQDIIPHKPEGKCVVSFDENQTISDAMRILAKHALLSAPVMSPEAESTADGQQPKRKLIGWVDVNGIILELIKSIEEKLDTKHHANMLHMMSVLEQEGPAFAERPVSSLLGSSPAREQVQYSERSMPLQVAVHNFFVGRGGDMPAVHRLAILADSGDIEHILTQMDVLKFMHDRHGSDTVAKKTLEEAGMLQAGADTLVTIDINAPTLKALERLVSGGRSAVAVLSPEGGMVTNLSTSDLRFLQSNHFGILALPVGEFLGLLHDAVYVGACAVDGDLRRSSSTGTGTSSPAHKSLGAQSATVSTAAPSSPGAPVQHGEHQFFAQRPGGVVKQVPLVTCGKDTTVAEAMRMMVAGHVHRVYIVEEFPGEEFPKPLAVVTTADMIHFASEHLLAGGEQ